VGCAENCVNLG